MACVRGGKGLEQVFTPTVGNAGAIVADAQVRQGRFTAQPNVQHAPRRAVADGVVQQVARQLPQRPFVTADRHMRRGLQLKFQLFFHDQRCQIECHRSHDGRPIGARRVGVLAHLSGLGQCQHLMGQLRGTLHCLIDFRQRLLGRHVTTPGGLHLRFQHRQGRAQLVGSIPHETLLQLQQIAQARHQLVVRVQQWLQFAWRVGHGQGGQIARGPFAQTVAQGQHRSRGVAHHEHHHPRDDQHQRRLPRQRAPQQTARQRLAQLQRFSDLDRGHRLTTFPGHGLQQHRHPHRMALVTVIVKIHQSRVRPFRRKTPPPARQSLEPGHRFPRKPGDFVVEAAAVVGLKRLQC